jgi:transcriptional regulator with GAF, ATPase, and Fis domain
MFRVLDVREIFDQLSTIAKDVLRHDFATLGLFLEGGTKLVLYVQTIGGPFEFRSGPMPFPTLQTDAWLYRFVDDLASNPLERHGDSVKGGGRSSIRVAVRLEDTILGALNFTSRDPSPYTAIDLAVCRRVAEYVALALSHYRLAEEARLNEALRARAENLESRVRALTEELDVRTGVRRLVGESARWRQVLKQSTQVATTETTVLLLGESGTGKEVVARFLHRASSRSGGSFIALNCAALPEQLLEAELFGYERGAYTGATHSKPGQLELAAGGTLFLDEVGEMSPAAQAKFLRVLQEREFQRLGGTRVLRTDARIVAATNRDLRRAIANGQFREDLYYRLNVFAIQLPPLRERREDILPLSDAFLAEIGRGLGRPPAGISRDAREVLTEYHWPGNVRELHNILERAAILCEGGLITAEHLAIGPPPPPDRAAPAAAASTTLPTVTSAGDLQSLEREMVEQALQKARFNKSKAAKALGLTRQQLYVRMRRYGLE